MSIKENLKEAINILPESVRQSFDFCISPGIVENMGVEILDFTGFDALQLETLPLHHKDPFDRMIISQALSNNYSVISYDNKFGLYECKLV